MSQSPEELWATKYAPLFAEEKAKEDARREEAFLDLPLIVCGESIRAMTPMDLLVLNGVNSPFVCGGEITREECEYILWFLNTTNSGRNSFGDAWRSGRMIRRLTRVPLSEIADAITAYVESTFQDAPEKAEGESRPLGLCFIVPMIMRIAQATGWSRQDIMRTPLAQLFQLLKVQRAWEQGKDFVDVSPSDRITGRFLAELNGAVSGGN
jgi:hypothetical protein